MPTDLDPGASLTIDLAPLESILAAHDRLVVAFSGGADSAFLAYAALRALGPDRVTAVTAISPSLPTNERAECSSLAAAWGLAHVEIETDEMDNAAYRRNDADRCFWCKDALMQAVGPLAESIQATVALGVNVDDLGDHRPGQQAAADAGAVFPLVEAGYTKAMVRTASRQLGLATWDKPAAACLASRIPYGTSVSVSVLSRVERAEAALRQLGFGAMRVRHYDDTARIEVPLDDLGRVLDLRSEVVDAVTSAGYRYVTLDLEGLRSGNLNAALGG